MKEELLANVEIITHETGKEEMGAPRKSSIISKNQNSARRRKKLRKKGRGRTRAGFRRDSVPEPEMIVENTLADENIGTGDV
jgi:hypothetical protein